MSDRQLSRPGGDEIGKDPKASRLITTTSHGERLYPTDPIVGMRIALREIAAKILDIPPDWLYLQLLETKVTVVTEVVVGSLATALVTESVDGPTFLFADFGAESAAPER